MWRRGTDSLHDDVRQPLDDCLGTLSVVPDCFVDSDKGRFFFSDLKRTDCVVEVERFDRFSSVFKFVDTFI